MDQRDFIYERSGAVFSPDRVHRYVLWRDIDLVTRSESQVLMFIGLNPSTADECTNDPTVRKCIGFARLLGYGRMVMTNAFAYRSTDPLKLYQVNDPVGQQNNEWLQDCASKATTIVAAWGKRGRYLDREAAILNLLGRDKLKCLGKNFDKTPKHPLYLPYTSYIRPLL